MENLQPEEGGILSSSKSPRIGNLLYFAQCGEANSFALRPLSAFLRRHRKESGCLLMHVFTAAFRALDLALFVFRKGEDGFERFLTIFAEKFVTRHGGHLNRTLRNYILQRPRLGMAVRKITSAILLELLQESFAFGVQLLDFFEIMLRGGPPGSQLTRLQETQLTADVANSRFNLTSAFGVHRYSRTTALGSLCG